MGEPAVDLIGRVVNIGDYVVFHNNIYIVEKLPVKPNGRYSYISIKLARPSKTTRAQQKSSGECCILPKDDMVAYVLKGGSV